MIVPDHLQVPVLVCHARGQYCLAANEGFARLAGGARQDVVGCPLADVLVAPRALGDLPVFAPARLRRQDGTEVTTGVLALPVRSGVERAFLCVFMDAAGVAGWRKADLDGAIDAVLHEEMAWFSDAVVERMARTCTPATCPSGLAQLTARERQVLALVCEGRDDRQIAACLGISRNTVRNHLANIYDKTGARRRSDAVIWGRERGMAA